MFVFGFDVDGKDYHVQHMYLIETWRVIRHVYHMHLDLHCTTIVVVVARDCFEFPLGFFSFARMLCSQAHCLQFTNHTLFLPKTVRSKLVILLSQFYDYTQYDFNCMVGWQLNTHEIKWSKRCKFNRANLSHICPVCHFEMAFLMRNDKTAEKNKSNKTDEMSSI